ncbi:MAG: aspartate ammonia-lyase, partial [Candidatus Bathyarchaeota archaeon]
MASTHAVRIEEDLLGVVEVPTSAYYGAQTQRARNNFPLNGEKMLGDYPMLVHALLWVKKASAQANTKIGYLKNEYAHAICVAVDKVFSEPYSNHFPIHALHGGGGTSANMNINEVLANFAEEFLGGQRGEYQLIHPNDHVNLHQSTNDVYPTACHIAVIQQWSQLHPILSDFAEAFHRIGLRLHGQPRLARTCLQDAVETTYADFFSGYVAFIHRAQQRIDVDVNQLYNINLGGTIVGRIDDVPSDYYEQIIVELRSVMRNNRYVQAENLFDAAQNPDTMIAVSAALNLFARGLIKIVCDLRLLSSGPEAGIGELVVSPMQPGSSIMPGKINPVIPEFVFQLCMQVCGKHAACEAALDHGELDLNVWESLIVINILDAMNLLATAVSTLTEKC